MVAGTVVVVPPDDGGAVVAVLPPGGAVVVVALPPEEVPIYVNALFMVRDTPGAFTVTPTAPAVWAGLDAHSMVGVAIRTRAGAPPN